MVKKAQQRLFFLRKQKQAQFPPKLLLNFYRTMTERTLTNIITVWYRSCAAAEQKNRVGKTTQCVVGLELPHLEDVYTNEEGHQHHFRHFTPQLPSV